MKNYSNCKLAINLVFDGKWDESHQIAQETNNNVGRWIHAVLHKIEGDESNSKYWYTRSNLAKFEDFNNASEELMHILHYIDGLSIQEE